MDSPRVPLKKFSKVFLEVMTPWIIEDLKIKMAIANQTPPDMLVTQFFEMCSKGREIYVQAEQVRFPGKSREDIILDYYRIQERLSKQRR